MWWINCNFFIFKKRYNIKVILLTLWWWCITAAPACSQDFSTGGTLERPEIFFSLRFIVLCSYVCFVVGFLQFEGFFRLDHYYFEAWLTPTVDQKYIKNVRELNSGPLFWFSPEITLENVLSQKQPLMFVLKFIHASHVLTVKQMCAFSPHDCSAPL